MSACYLLYTECREFCHKLAGDVFVTNPIYSYLIGAAGSIERYSSKT